LTPTHRGTERTSEKVTKKNRTNEKSEKRRGYRAEQHTLGTPLVFGLRKW